MATMRRRAIALAVLAAAISQTCWAASNPRMKFAAPTAQEETIYRPECPSDETSSTGLPCRIAGANGG
jgi:hypothetical protein